MPPTTRQARFKAVAFADGEDVTYLRGERDRLTVSGLKGDRIFYRKVMLACGGTIWRHVAMEYPATAKGDFDRFVERMSRGFDHIADDACGDNLFASPQPANAPAPRSRKRTRSRRRTEYSQILLYSTEGSFGTERARNKYFAWGCFSIFFPRPSDRGRTSAG